MARPVKTKNAKMTSIVFGDEDRANIEVIRNKFGLRSDSDAIRMALKLTAEANVTLAETAQ